MTTGKYLPFLLLISLLTACGSEDEKATPDVPSSVTTPSQTQPATPPAAAPAPAPAPANTSAPAPQNMALNPAHGQPGHRCDIAVGAPLNSAPATTAQPAATVQSAPVQAAPAPAPATDLNPSKGVINSGSAATGLNPAHGLPGHRCDIAVGAPLNSKPLKQ
jgi:uncharacterized protein YvpB